MDLTVKEAAHLLQTSESNLYRWIQSGKLPSYCINDHYRLNRVELLEWATSNEMKVSPEIFHQPESLPTDLLTDAIGRGGVLYDVPGTDKPLAIKAICQGISLPTGVSRDDLYGVLLAREALGSTAIGNGVAIPHPRSPLILGVRQPIVTLAFLRQPIDFGALDGRPVSILFTIISTTIHMHLQMLSHLMFALQDQAVEETLQSRAPAGQILQAIQQAECRIGNAASTSAQPGERP